MKRLSRLSGGLIPLAAVVFALLIGALMILALGANPAEGYYELVKGAFGSGDALTDTAVRAMPLLLVGTGICIAFRAKVINIGGEGQIIAGALVSTMTALAVPGLPPEFSARGVLKLGAIKEQSKTLVDQFAVKTPSIDTMTSALSGGNIQKLIMARELSSDPGVLIASQPTRGVDIGAAEYIHERLVEQRGKGTAIVVISEDLDEVLGLADRVAVIFEGKVVALRDRADCNVEELGLLMAGG